jgi:hypothetical protein
MGRGSLIFEGGPTNHTIGPDFSILGCPTFKMTANSRVEESLNQHMHDKCCEGQGILLPGV